MTRFITHARCTRLAATATLATIAGLGASVPTAQANIYGSYTDKTHLSYRVTGMTDFDQKRAALANPFRAGLPNDGRMYCVPTSSMNLMAYIARHGYPNIQPGLQPYGTGDIGVYNDVGGWLAWMGAAMGTSPTGGTGGTGWYNGTRAWLPEDQFDVCRISCSGDWCPKFWELGKWGLYGGIVSFCYGRYSHVGSNELVERTGGHCVTLTRVHRDTNIDLFSDVRYHDPSNGSSFYSQATFAEKEVVAADLFFLRPNGITRKMSAINFDFDSDTWRMLDGAMLIYPKQSWTNWPQINEIFQNTPSSFAAPSTPSWSFDSSILSIAPSPTRTEVLVMRKGEGGGPSQLELVDPLEPGDPVLIAEVGNARGVEWASPRRFLYVDGRSVISHDLERGDIVATETLPASASCQATAFCRFSNSFLMLSPTDDTIYIADGGLATLPFPTPLPTGLELSGTLSMSCDPDTGALWIASKGTDELIRLEMVTGLWQQTASISCPSPDSVQVNENGNVFCVSGGEVVEHEQDSTGAWQVVADGQFAGQPAGPVFRLSMSWDNVGCEPMDGPSWNNVETDELMDMPDLPPCPADINGDGFVNLTDLNIVLANYGTNHPSSDIDFSGTVDVADLNRVLAVFNTACD